ncbi:nephrin [Orussus abietinus]|uniref:nephrin n=1 Tax=Orussus abietinus TaxID=222816 RepID=UPI000C715FC4|nr:nephrin [Orussus abietinus]
MRCRPVAALLLALFGAAAAHAQGGPRTFSARPFRGGPTRFVRAVLRGTAVLPCDIRPPRANDSAIIVAWYKNDDTPIYSYDTRGKNAEQAPHWKNKQYFEDRAYFRTLTEPASLNIERVEERDEGEYRCRVDFAKSPTRNSKIHLTVIVPPRTPNIIDEHGKTVTGEAGPYEEGGDMKLTCLVSGGRPEPSVKWWRGETLLEPKDSRGDFPDLRRNTLLVTGLTRSHSGAVFTCQASNDNVSQPVSASVTVRLHLRPLGVSILSSEQAPLSADRKYEIACMTFGSRPPARLSWFMDGKRLINYTETVSPDGNSTTSTLVLKPTLLDHEKLITCRAENPKVRDGVEEDTWKLNVYFVPILHLELGSNMNPDDIEEGDDVYFECKVHANPWAYKVVWHHNGNVIQNDAKNGVIVQQYDLALRKVNRSQAGNYSCVASNIEGDGYSNSVELKIMYKPICVGEQKRVYGVARHEDARVVCRVEAYPPPDSFRWAFNNTEEMVDVPQSRYENSTRHTQSILTYRPVTEMDYGTVLCWASNAAGQQRNACVFHVIPAGKPEPPYNCTLTNQTTESLSVECSAGFDGGQPQHFLLEVFDQETGSLKANVTSREAPSPVFTVHGLGPGKVLNMVLTAVNAKGRSDPTLLEGFTLKVAEKQTGIPVPFEITPLLCALIGVVTALLLVTVTILAALKVRSERRSQRPGDLPPKKTTTLSAEDLYDADDRNPDVVPTNKGTVPSPKGSDYQLTGSAVGTPLTAQNESDGLPLHLRTLSGYGHPEYRSNPALPFTGEVTYAELCLSRPVTLSTLSALSALTTADHGVGSGAGTNYVRADQRTTDPTVYASIDHTARPPRNDRLASPSRSEVAPQHHRPLHDHRPHLHPHHQQPPEEQQRQPPRSREVVTVRTPLISTQESCV